MSKRIGTLYHPTNKEPAYIYEGFSWPCLFLGSIWFAVKGMWLWAIGSFLIVSSTCGLAWLIFPFFANGMYKKHLRQNGWLNEEQAKGTAPIGQQQQFAPNPLATATFTAPLAAANIQPQAASAAPPLQQQAVQISQPPTPTAAFNVATPPQPQPTGSLKSKSLIVAKLDSGISWKNEYDVLDAEAGAVLLELREGEKGSMTKIARMGTLATTSGFDIMFKTTDGQPCFRVKGGGMKGGGEVYNGSDAQIGKIKRAHLASMNFEGLDPQGASKFKTKSKGIGVLTFGHDIRKGDAVIGSIKDIDKGTAKTVLGANFDRLNNARKYDYAYHVSLTNYMEDLDKALLLGTVYCIAHISGRI